MKKSKEVTNERDWRTLFEKLKNNQLPTQEIGPAIVKLGKPFDEKKISRAREVVATFLHHEDAWVRHEAMWFLTSWGKLCDYRGALIDAAQNDPDGDNRIYAVSCLGSLDQGSGNAIAVSLLKSIVEDCYSDELLRKYAYRSLLQIARSGKESVFSPNESQLSEIDFKWVRSL